MLFIVAFAWLLGMAALHLLQKAGVSWAGVPSPSTQGDPGPVTSPLAELGPRQKAEEELEGVLQEIAAGNTNALPSILPWLRYIFDRLGRSEDAAWCQAEVDGYGQDDDTPQYRYANVTLDWSSGRSVVTMDIMSRKPEESVLSLPMRLPVDELVQLSHRGRKTATGKTVPDFMGAWRQIAEISPQAVQGVLRRISNEAYQRALAAKATEPPA